MGSLEFNITDLTNNTNIEELQDQLANSKIQKINIRYADNVVLESTNRYLAFSLFFYKIAIKWKIPITSDLHLEKGFIDSKYITRYGTKIFKKIMENNNDPNMSSKIINLVNYDLWKLINDVMNFILLNCQEYNKSVSIFDLAKIKKSKDIKDTLDMKNDPATSTVKKVEDELKEKTTNLYTMLQNKVINGNVNKLYPFIKLKYINPTQLSHIFNWIGYRTDIDDTIMSYCIKTNYLDGLKSIFDFTCESLSAKKSAYYQKAKMPPAQYFLRTQHLLASSISKIYPGDCGSNITVPFMITKENAKNIIGKNIVINKKIVQLTPDNIKDFIGKVVNMRSICKYTDGVCEVCGGKIFQYIPKNMNIGVFSSIQVADPVAQSILSNKHYQQTDSREYELSPKLKELFIKVKQNVFIRRSYFNDPTKIKIGFPVSDVKNFFNIENLNIKEISSINENNFGNIANIYMKYGDNIIIDGEDTGYYNTYPLFSKNMIFYINNHKENIEIINGIYWVSLKDFNLKEPLFKTVIINDSIIEFVKEVKNFIKVQIKTYTSYSEILNDFSQLLYKKLSMNISFIEVMLKAYMITSDIDFQIPVVTDIENVKFSSQLEINKNRSFGTLLAFERLPNALLNPMMYMVPKKHYLFDNLLNYKRIKI